MNKKPQMFVCQYCHKTFKIKRGRKILTLWELRKWLKISQCPFCGKKLRDG